MAGVAIGAVDDTLEILAVTVFVVVIDAILLFLTLDAGQWSDQRASRALVTESNFEGEGTLLYLGDPVEVTFVYGAWHPVWPEVGRIALAFTDVGALVLVRSTDWGCDTEV